MSYYVLYYKLDLRLIVASMFCHFNSVKFPHNLKEYIKWSHLLMWQDLLALFCWAWVVTGCLSHSLRSEIWLQFSPVINIMSPTLRLLLFVLVLTAHRFILSSRDLWLTSFYEGTFSGHKPKIYTITVAL